MFPKVPSVKGLVLRVELLGGGNFRWGLVGGPEVTGCVPLKGIVGTWPLPLLLLGHEGSSLFHAFPAIASQHPHRPESNWSA